MKVLRSVLTVFVSGFYVMVVELSSGRLMAPHFGQSAYTWTAITAATLAGLALGNTLGGRLAHWRKNGLRVACAGLLLAGLWCMAMPLFSTWTGHWLAAEATWGWTVRIGLYSGVLLIPVMLFLGMVSPGIAYLFVREDDTGRSVGTLYFWGMTGSLTGALLTGLWLPFTWPVTAILFYGGGILVVLGVFLLATSTRSSSGTPGETYTKEAHDGFRGIPVRMGLMVFLVATVCMGAEMAAIRLLTPVTGASYVVWSVSFGIFILGMGVGGWTGGLVSDLCDKRPFLFYWLMVTALTGLITPYLIKLAADTLWVSGWSWMPSLLSTSLVAFLPLSFALGVLSTVTTRTALKDEKNGEIRRKGIGLCYGLVSAGNVVGTLLAGYLLVGAIRMSAILLVMSFILVVSGLLLFHGSRQVASLVVTGAVILYSMVWGQASMDIRPIEVKALGSPLFDEESRYGRVSVYSSPDQPTRRTMMLDRVEHSTIDTSDPRNLYSLYTRVLRCALDVHIRGKALTHVCIIGGGGYALPRYFKHVRPDPVYVIEIDPIVTKAAAKVCALDLSTIENINLDGRLAIADLLRQGGRREFFDVIIGDTVNDAAIPYHLVTREFNDDIKRLLRKDGCYLLHILDNPGTGKLIASMLKTLRQTFACQAVIAVTGLNDVRQSHIIIASDQAVPLDRIHEELLRVYPEFEGKVYEQAEANTWASTEGAIVMSDAFAPIESLVLDSLLRSTGYQVSRLLKKTQEALGEKRYKAASTFVEAAFSKNADNADVLKLIYTLYDHTKENTLLGLLERSAQRPSGSAIAKHYYAQALMVKGQPMDAAIIWDALAKRFVQLPEFLGYASRAYAAGGQLSEAYDRANRLAEGVPHGSPEWQCADSLRRQIESMRRSNPDEKKTP